MKRLKIISVILFGFCGILIAHAQQARVPGLEGYEPYMELLKEQEELKKTEESTLKLINETRKQFEDSRKKGTSQSGADYGQKIVKLEGELFEIRSKMGRITSRISEIEQDYILRNMGQGGSSETSGASQNDSKQAKTLFYNSFFTENLVKNDVTLFSLTPKVEPEVIKINKRIKDLYGQLETVKRQYEQANDQEIIDSLSVRASVLKDQIEQEDALMDKLWLPIYNRKMDLYPVLLDKIGRVDRLKLEQLDQESRAVRRAEGLAGEQLAPLLTTFPLQKQLALSYETIMAELLGLNIALDSLKAEYKKIPDVDSMIYEDIEFEPRNLVIHSPIKLGVTIENAGASEFYTEIQDIPQLQIPKKGVYYAIQLSIYTTPPKITVFKGASPMRQEKLPDGRTRYTAGGFDTYTEAQKALTQMQRGGFNAPRVVAWIDGKTATITQVRAAEKERQTAAEQAGDGLYCVDIIPAEARLSTGLREIIEKHAKAGSGISIVRSTNARKEVVYSVGNFTNRVDAERLAAALSEEPKVKVQVTEIQ